MLVDHACKKLLIRVMIHHDTVCCSKCEPAMLIDCMLNTLQATCEEPAKTTMYKASLLC